MAPGTAHRVRGRLHFELLGPPVAIVDTVGAGDAFGGGFLARWIERGLGRARPGRQRRASATRSHSASRSRSGPASAPAPTRRAAPISPCVTAPARLPCHAIRRLFPLAFASLLLRGDRPGAGGHAARFPTQSLGNRGVDVQAVQGLLLATTSRPASMALRRQRRSNAVKTFQASERPDRQRDRRDDDVGEASSSPCGPGEAVPAVVVQQTSSTRSVDAGLAVDGVYGTATRTAVVAFQKHMGMTRQRHRRPGDLAEAPVALRLPVVQDRACATTASATGRRTGGPARDRPARGGCKGIRVDRPRARFDRRRQLEHGGNIPLHQTHEVGLDVDIRPIRDNENQCTWGTNWRLRPTTGPRPERSSSAIRATAPGPRQAHLLQRSGPHPRGSDALVLRPRRPPAHPLLRNGVPDRRYRC